MRSKYFAVKIEKSVVEGRIQLKCVARQLVPGYSLEMQNISSGASGGNYGLKAYIFWKGNNGQLRNSNSWENDGFTTDNVVIVFPTGAQASKYIETIRQKLTQLDTIQDCIQAECDALEVD